ncbi:MULTISPECIES: c-type heme family protein [Acetobacter]|uniref:c-type heme family protein n=1 Tax=Acetobacter TaxID=434 RepID=UPI000A3ABF96|nr:MULTISPECIES: DUF3365 domain-containing protein [Acetobacter]MBS0979645.1 DUF3365 domain-containing protein [Acetobacter thailandicus]MBS1003271.1 DUF3365 domain-containing protein [Acetobacter thailandicus]OUI87765.1 hypothetical protein HK11_10335 [Acetobacter sp. DmW_043]OUJ12063.1 hypothetical protein HK25_04525 [Acetobacter sp. DsW_059]
MTLRLKLNLTLVTGFLITLAVLVPLLRSTLSQTAYDAAISQAQLLNQVSQITEQYNEKEITPQLLQSTSIDFPPQSVPFYAVSHLGALLRQDHAGLNIRATALNPTNPADAPTPVERNLIERLRSPSAPAMLLSNSTDSTGKPTLLLATPIRVTNSGCLTCHSDPAVAPGTMIDTYGSQNGFGWKPGETVGASIISIPVGALQAEATGKIWKIILCLSALFLIILAVINIIIEIAFLRPLHEMSAITGRVSRGDMTAPELAINDHNELAPLASAFTRLRRSLESAFSMLDE